MLHIAGKTIFLIPNYDSSVLASHYFCDEIPRFLSPFWKPAMTWTLPYSVPGGAIRRLCTCLSPWGVQRPWLRPLRTITTFSKWLTGAGIKRWGAVPGSHEQPYWHALYPATLGWWFTLELLKVAPRRVHEIFVTGSWWGEYRNRK